MKICKRGHALTPDNFYLRPDGAKECRACRRLRRNDIIPFPFKAECVRGHPFSGDNLVIRPSGKRECRACNTIRHRKRTAKLKTTLQEFGRFCRAGHEITPENFYRRPNGGPGQCRICRKLRADRLKDEMQAIRARRDIVCEP